MKTGNRHEAIGTSKKSDFLALLCALLFALSVPVEAQQANKIPRIGILFNTTPASAANINEAFKQGLRELDYVDRKNILLEYRYAKGQLERLRQLAAELVHLKVDVILASGTPAVQAAVKVTTAVPIVTVSGDPVETRFVTSLARPGGNITGLSSLALEISGKQLELLKEIIPKLSRVVVLGSSTNAGNAHALKETELAAAALGVQLHYLDA
jgi:putative ABC transport system substrate-binding protein